MKAAGWARESTFRTFYDEPLSCSENLGNNLYPTVFLNKIFIFWLTIVSLPHCFKVSRDFVVM